MGIKTKLPKKTNVFLLKYTKEKQKEGWGFLTEKGGELYTSDGYTAYFTGYAEMH